MKNNLDKNLMNVVIFCGGRGSSTLIHELLRRDNISLTLLINAYDDGLSTGALRNYIPGMLGPSDFRKCMTYLLALYSGSQFFLLNVLEFRLPKDVSNNYISSLKKWVMTGSKDLLASDLRLNIDGIDLKIIEKIRALLTIIFDYIDQSNQEFNFKDCALGNLIFSGAYLKNNHNFNKAAEELSSLVSIQAKMVNVSDGENLTLCALKSNGDLLKSEADIVNPQSKSHILYLFFLKEPLNKADLNKLNSLSYQKKRKWLFAKNYKPRISYEADFAIKNADIIIYGPGTQHSSLYPSYIIAAEALKKTKASIKAMILNIGPDNDIKTFTSEDLINRMLHYSGDSRNSRQVISHVLYNNTNKPENESPCFKDDLSNYKNIIIKKNNYENIYLPNTHNGSLVISDIVKLWHNSPYKNDLPTLSIYLNFDNRREKELAKILYELLEVNWDLYSRVLINIFGVNAATEINADFSNIKFSYYDKVIFDETKIFENWIAKKDKSDFIAIIGGDGQYRFRDLALASNILQESSFAAIYGSRTQNRRQNLQSIKAAYSENLLLFFFSFIGSFLISLIMTIRTGVIFSDPLTNFRIFSRSKLSNFKYIKCKSYFFGLSYLLLKQGFEIAEIPVSYKTYRGFIDSKSRFIKGLKSLANSFT